MSRTAIPAGKVEVPRISGIRFRSPLPVFVMIFNLINQNFGGREAGKNMNDRVK